MSQTNVRPYLTTREVAEILNVKPQTLDMWASKGRGPAYYKIEGIRRYDAADLEQYLADRKVSR